MWNYNIEERLEKLEKKNKESKGVIIALAIIIVILVLLLLMANTNILQTIKTGNQQTKSGNEVTENSNNNSNTNNSSTNTVTEPEVITNADITNTAQGLIDTLSKSSGCRYLNYFVSSSKLTANSIPGYVAFQLVMFKDVMISYDTPTPDVILASDIGNLAKKYLGKNYEFVPENAKECINYKYDLTTRSYKKTQSGCGGACEDKGYTVDSAYKQDTYLFANVTNKGTKYLFTFVLEDGNYIFVSSEPAA